MRSITFALALLISTTAIAGDCGKVVYRDASAAAKGVTRVVISGHTGLVHIRGQAGATNVQVNGRACSTSDAALAAVGVKATRSGTTVQIEAVSSEAGPPVDISVELPASVAVDVTLASGEVIVRDVASARVAVGKGFVMVSDISGSVAIEEPRAGRTVVSKVGGDLSIGKSIKVEYDEIKGRVISNP